MNYCDKASNVEAFVNQSFSFKTVLDIPDIKPDNKHVRFRKNLDDF